MSNQSYINDCGKPYNYPDHAWRFEKCHIHKWVIRNLLSVRPLAKLICEYENEITDPWLVQTTFEMENKLLSGELELPKRESGALKGMAKYFRKKGW